MTTPKRTLDVWVVYDNDGDYVVGTDRDATIEEYADEFGSQPVRVVNLQLRVPSVVDVTAEVDVPEENARVTVR